MRAPSSRLASSVLVVALPLLALAASGGVLVACGTILGLEEDPSGVPDRLDGAADGASEGAVGASDATTSTGDADLDASASDAEGGGADACATPASCSAELLTKLPVSVTRLVLAGSSLYAGHASGHVYRFAAGAPGAAIDLDPYAVFPDVFGSLADIAVDPNGAVYWGTVNGMRRHESGVGADASIGAGVTELSALGAPVDSVRVGADGRLHFAVRGPQVGGVNNGHYADCDLPGCTNVQSSAYVPQVQDVIAIGAAHWWMGTDAAFNNLALRGPALYVSGNQFLPSRMVTDGARIFWSTYYNLAMFTIAGTSLVELLPAATDGTTRVNGVALDPGGTLYVTKQSQVLRCALASNQCTLVPIATTPGTATDVAVDATHVYWGTDDGSVWRLRKP